MRKFFDVVNCMLDSYFILCGVVAFIIRKIFWKGPFFWLDENAENYLLRKKGLVRIPYYKVRDNCQDIEHVPLGFILLCSYPFYFLLLLFVLLVSAEITADYLLPLESVIINIFVSIYFVFLCAFGIIGVFISWVFGGVIYLARKI